MRVFGNRADSILPMTQSSKNGRSRAMYGEAWNKLFACRNQWHQAIVRAPILRESGRNRPAPVMLALFILGHRSRLAAAVGNRAKLGALRSLRRAWK